MYDENNDKQFDLLVRTHLELQRNFYKHFDTINWKSITLQFLKNSFPLNVSKAECERFLNDMKQETRNPTISIPNDIYLRYPKKLLSNNNYRAVVANAEYYQGGYAERMQEEYINDLIEDGDWEGAAQGKKDLSVIRQMPEFYDIVKRRCINAFRDNNPAFKDVEIPFRTPIEGNIPLKRMKEMLDLGMSEFKSQQRDYYAKWEEWRGVKEEWLGLALDEDNLTQCAEWSIDAYEKQIRTAVQKAINTGIEKAALNFSAREIYATLQPTLDPEGFYLSRAAEKLTGFDIDSEYPVEDGMHYFETMNGFGMLRFLEADKFGECRFKIIHAWTEVMDKYIIHSDTPQFKAYQDSIFERALEDLKRSASRTSDIKDCLTAVADLKSTGTVELMSSVSPPIGWVNVDEHMKSYAIRYVDAEQQYNERYKMPESTDYRMYETFEYQPDDKVPPEPDFEVPLPQEKRSDKLLNIFRPERESARLQSELKVLIKNTDTMRDFAKHLDESILEMKGEISAMKELAVKANQEIQSGKHFNDWMRLNLAPEIKALGLDSAKATFQDLMKTLSQNIAEPPHIQDAAIEMG